MVEAAYQICDDGERSWRDADLVTFLGFKRVEKVRELIRRNVKRLERFGVLSRYGINSEDPVGRGRPAEGFLADFKQAVRVNIGRLRKLGVLPRYAVNSETRYRGDGRRRNL